MKKLILIVQICMFWIAISTTNVHAADFSIVDSDGDVYHIGDYLGSDLNTDLYRVQFYEGSSIFPSAEGLLIYDPVLQSLKITINENDVRYGFTLEGHWSGSGSTIFFLLIVNENGRESASFGELELFKEDQLPRKGAKKSSVKKNSKKHNKK